jgi:hypothetical protein
MCRNTERVKPVNLACFTYSIYVLYTSICTVLFSGVRQQDKWVPVTTISGSLSPRHHGMARPQVADGGTACGYGG